MNIKRLTAFLIAALMALSLAACSNGGNGAGTFDDAEDDPNEVKTGFAVISEVRTDEADPGSIYKRSFVSTVAAVIVDTDGRIVKAKVDVMEINADLENNGGVVENPKTRMEQGAEYNYLGETALQSPWCDQLAAVEEFAQGKTAKEFSDSFDYFSGITYDEELLTKCDIDVGCEVKAIAQAANDARALGADDKNELKLAITAKNFEPEEEGDFLAYRMEYATVTMDKDGVITSCIVDESEAKCGIIDGEYAEFPGIYDTKRQMGTQYGMKDVSPIGAEWDEQAKALEYFAAGKTPDELLASVGSDNVTTDADLITTCTIEINEMVDNIIKAADK